MLQNQFVCLVFPGTAKESYATPQVKSLQDQGSFRPHVFVNKVLEFCQKTVNRGQKTGLKILLAVKRLLL